VPRKAGEGNIRQRKDGRWEARLRYVDPIDGLSKREHFYGRTQRDALLALQEAQRRIARSTPIRDDATPLADFLDWWLKNVVRPSRREQTYLSYESIVANRLEPSAIARIALRDLRPAMIQSVLVNLRRAPTRSDALAVVVLRIALGYAVKAGLLRANPASDVETPKPERGELKRLTATEARRFLEAAKRDRLYALYHLVLHTGLRSGELLALEWRDVDLRAGTVRVQRSLKTRAARRAIALLPESIAVLRAHRDRMKREGHAAARVFVSEGGSRLDPANFQRKSFKPLLRAARCPNVRFHDLRHTVATLLLERGVHPKVVSELLGHASVATTMNVYQHVDARLMRGAAAAIADALRVRHRKGESGGRCGGQDAANPMATERRRPARR
jgi:integrase